MTGTRRVRVGHVRDIPAGGVQIVEANGAAVAVFNVEGVLYAIDNHCPHRGGPLGEGELDGTTLTCPWHAWRWDVTTGANTNNPASRVACFPVVVESGVVFVELRA